jgi:hypothetical protein
LNDSEIGVDRATQDPTTRFRDLIKTVRNEALIEAEPSIRFLSQTDIEECPGGNIYYGTGLTTPTAISVGLPFDVLGIMLTAEKIRRVGQFGTVYHHIADTHAKTNHWIDQTAVDSVASETIRTLEEVKRNLKLDDFQFVLSSSFDATVDYRRLVETFASSDEHEYVRRELADIEWYRTHADVRLKIGWIIQAKETEVGFDERRFDREYLRFYPAQMSFVYTKPGRTFDLSRPKVSPYITVANERRLRLAPGVDVGAVFAAANDPNLGGARKHIQSIVRLYESLFGDLGKISRDGLTLEDKVQTIIDRCFCRRGPQVSEASSILKSSSRDNQR